MKSGWRVLIHADMVEMIKITWRNVEIRGHREARRGVGGGDQRNESKKEVIRVAAISLEMKIKMRIRKTVRAGRQRERGVVPSPSSSLCQAFFSFCLLSSLLQEKKTCFLFAGRALCAWHSPYWIITLTEDDLYVDLCASALRRLKTDGKYLPSWIQIWEQLSLSSPKSSF